VNRPLVIGHRGFAGRFPDNSLAGVKAALVAGADGVEVDVRPSGDGVWVCHHDLRCRGTPVVELASGALRRWGVASLEEAVTAVPADRWLYVEVKPLPRAALARHLDGLLELLYRRPHRLRVISSSLPVLGELERVLPGASFSWVFAELPEWLPVRVELSPRHTLVERLLAAGRPLHPWTVNRPSRVQRLATLGVVSLTTDYPDRAVEVLGG